MIIYFLINLNIIILFDLINHLIIFIKITILKFHCSFELMLFQNSHIFLQIYLNLLLFLCNLIEMNLIFIIILIINYF